MVPRDSRENKTNCFPPDHTLSVYYSNLCSIYGKELFKWRILEHAERKWIKIRKEKSSFINWWSNRSPKTKQITEAFMPVLVSASKKNNTMLQLFIIISYHCGTGIRKKSARCCQNTVNEKDTIIELLKQVFSISAVVRYWLKSGFPLFVKSNKNKMHQFT